MAYEEYYNGPSDEFEDRWADFMAVEGMELEDSIAHNIQRDIGKLDMLDGTHGQWIDEQLGVLIVFQGKEAQGIVSSWKEATTGNLVALTSLMNWLEGFSFFLEDCIETRDGGGQGLD